MLLPLSGPFGNEARMVLAVAQQPRFADGAIAGQLRGKQTGQTPAAPKPILIDRFKSKRIQRYFILGVSFCCHAHVLYIAAVYCQIFSASDWHHWLRMAMKRPAQITGHQIDRHGREHHDHAKPNSPIPMRASPIRRLAVMNRAAIRIAVRFVIVV